MDKIQEINELKIKYNSLMANKVRIEEKLRLKKMEQEKILQELNKLGLSGVDLDSYIVEAENKLQQVREKVKEFELSLDKML
jgi:flagellar biosynthesis chaperone FliJ